MSERAYDEPISTPPRAWLEPDLRAVVDRDGPEGPFFNIIFAGPIDTETLKRDAEQLRRGDAIILRIFEHLGVIDTWGTAKALSDELDALKATNPKDTDRIHALEGRVRTREFVSERLLHTMEDYSTNYWDNFEEHKGYDIDLMSDLYENTEPYENCTILQITGELSRQSPNADYLKDADRLARMMILSEVAP